MRSWPVDSRYIIAMAHVACVSWPWVSQALVSAPHVDINITYSPLFDIDVSVSTDFDTGAAPAMDVLELAAQPLFASTDFGSLSCAQPMIIVRYKMGARLGSTWGSREPWRGRSPRLRSCPHARGLVVRVCVMNPKKPNSAMRHVAKLKLYRKPRVTSRIPGRGFGVSKFNRALSRGGRANDLPGVNYTLCRGVYDFPPLFGKKRRRSFYGLARPQGSSAFVRRKLRRCQGSRLHAGSYPAEPSAILGPDIRPASRLWPSQVSL